MLGVLRQAQDERTVAQHTHVSPEGEGYAGCPSTSSGRTITFNIINRAERLLVSRPRGAGLGDEPADLEVEDVGVLKVYGVSAAGHADKL